MQFKQQLVAELGMGSTVHGLHMPKHARQKCDVIYGPPLPLSGILPIVSRIYNPLTLRELSASLVVGNTSPTDLQS